MSKIIGGAVWRSLESRGAMVCGFCREKQILSPSARGIRSGVFIIERRRRRPRIEGVRLLDIGRATTDLQARFQI